jgi:Leucine-rich repeat (LRR) protein/signal recognition particle receptor subunit beta
MGFYFEVSRKEVLERIEAAKQEKSIRLIFQDYEYWNFDGIPEELLELTDLQELSFRPANVKDYSILRKLIKLKSLNFTNNRISDYSFLEELPNLSSLNLSANQISNVRFLKKLINLTSLDISSNQISDCSFLEKLPNLTMLNLSSNQISDYSFLEKLPNLTTLNFSSNQISDYSFLEKLPNLTTLNFSSNQISDYSFLEKLPNLTTLNLRSNQISDIHFLEKLPNLTSLNLSSNQVSDIRFLEKLPNLTRLNLGSNQVSDIRFLEKLPNLTSLNLSSNQISDYSFLEKLPNLTSLNLSSNQISDIHFLKKLPNLNMLNLRSNQISDCSFLEKLPNLTSLSLSSNQISDYSFLEKLPNLTSLNLSSNQILDYSFLENLMRLRALNLRDSQISDIHFLENLTTLRTLDLSYNQISDIKPLISLIKKAKKNILYRSFSIIPQSDTYEYFQLMDNLINIHNNPLENPPIEIVKQGNVAILKYFEALEAQETIELYEAKMLIIGEGGVGKTSLLRKFISKENKLPEEKETTKGIDIQEYHFQTGASQDFRINMWDFGGQEIYHSTHQFFLTKRSLYVLVDDTRKDDKTIHDATFNYWLQTVELFGSGSPIVIVQNEKGDRSKVLDLKSIQSNFSNVKGTYATNLLTCRNLAETKTALQFFIQQLPHIGAKLPKSWVDIRNEVEDLKRPRGLEADTGTYYISREKYFEICKKHKVDEDTALILSQYFHDLGMFLHFQDDDILCRTVILQNEWATDAVYKVLDCETVKSNRGRFTRDDLKTIWSDADCKGKYRNMHPELLALMKEFKLCYQITNRVGFGNRHGLTDTFLAPQLFEESQPDYDWDETDNLIVKLKYGFMPKGLISQFIVRMHRYVKDLETAWKHGVILEKTDTVYAEVVSLYAQQEIRIRVRGNDNKRFLDIVLEEFDKIHSLFEGIKVDKFIPCNCSLCKMVNWKGKYYFKYEVLKRAYATNILDIQCQESFQSVNVHRLINETLIAKQMEDFSRTSKEYERMKIIQNHSGKGDNIGRDKTEIHHHYTNAETPTGKGLFDNNPKRQPIDKTELKGLVIDGDTDEVFEVLLEKSQDVVLSREIELLKTNWRGIKRQLRKTTISDNDFEVKNAKIVESLLEWIGEW